MGGWEGAGKDEEGGQARRRPRRETWAEEGGQEVTGALCPQPRPAPGRQETGRPRLHAFPPSREHRPSPDLGGAFSGRPRSPPPAPRPPGHLQPSLLQAPGPQRPNKAGSLRAEAGEGPPPWPWDLGSHWPLQTEREGGLGAEPSPSAGSGPGLGSHLSGSFEEVVVVEFPALAQLRAGHSRQAVRLFQVNYEIINY